MSVLLISIPQEQSSSSGPINQQIATENVHADAIKFSKDENSESIAEKLLLNIVAVEETWMKVSVDELRAKEYILHKGDGLELEANSGFNLIIGNATGVNLTLNGKPVKVEGKDGQILNIQIP